MDRLLRRSRRSLVTGGAFGIAALVAASASRAADDRKPDDKDVGAVEDLMREHGVMRRALIVYSDTAARLRGDSVKVPAAPLARTAELFRRFGEGYHEMTLEEIHIFPAVKKGGGPAAPLVDVLVAQHARGREITAYILEVAGKGAIAAANAEPLARALDSFVWMYRTHAAREDTVVFPAWKETLSESQLHEMGERFEDIEKQQFGKDGFEQAVREIADIERALGIADLAQFTAPPPPKT